MSAPATPSATPSTTPLADTGTDAGTRATPDAADPQAAARRAGPTGTSRHPSGAFDDEEDDEPPMGDPADLRDEGVLESLGKAVSSPVRSAAGEEAEEHPQDASKPRPTAQGR